MVIGAWQARRAQLSFTFCIALLTTGCSPGQTGVGGVLARLFPPPFSRVPAPSEEEPTSSRASEVLIYLDATLSMRGFVTLGEGTEYWTLVAENGLQAPAAGRPVRFFRFGSTVDELDRASALRAGTVSFYEAGDNLITKIDGVLGGLPESALGVIATDLFQTDADAGALADRLAMLVDAGRAVAIVGVRSDFQGVVYDVGVERRRFDYSTKGREPNLKRPFYVIIAGPLPDVVEYSKALFATLTRSGSEHHSVLLSNQLAPVVNTMDLKERVREGVVLRAGAVLERPDGVVPQATRVLEYVVRDSARPLRLGFDVPIETHASIPTIRNGDLPVTVAVVARTSESVAVGSELRAASHLGPEGSNLLPPTQLVSGDGNPSTNGEKSPTPQRQELQDPSGTQIAPFVDINALTRQLQISLTIAPGALQRRQSYLIQVDIMPEASQFEIPDWVNAWDMPRSQVSEWVRAPGAFRGDTTYNLRRIVTDTWTKIVREQQPTLGRFWLALGVR